MKVCIIGASGKLGKYMVETLTDDSLVHEAPAIAGFRSPSALEHLRRAQSR